MNLGPRRSVIESFSCQLNLSCYRFTMADDGHDEKAVAVAPPPPAELPEIKLFGRWSCDDVQISDMSLQVRVSSHVKRLQDIIPVVRLYLQQMSHFCNII